jgi:uncharacterized protein
MKTAKLLSLLFLSVAFLAACAGTVTPAAAPAQTASTQAAPANPISILVPTQQPAPRTISVTGEGKAEGAPDIAIANLGVETRDVNVAKAVADNNKKASAISQSVKALGVDAKDIQTTGFNVYFQDTFDKGQPTGLGIYVVGNTISITVRDLGKLGQILGNALDAGANSVSGVTFTVADPSGLFAEARNKAMADAQARADQLAKGMRVQIVRVLTVNEGNSYAPPAAYLKSSALAGVGGGGPVPVESGTYIVTMQVSAVFEIQ